MRQIIENFKKIFRDTKLRSKFIYAYLFLLVVPMLITTLLFYSYLTQSVQRQTSEVIAQSMKQTAEYINYILKEIEGLGDVFFNNGALQETLSEKNSDQYDDLKEFTYISGVINQIRQNDKVFNITLYVPDSKFYSRERKSIFPFTDIVKDAAIGEVLKNNKQRGWSGIRDEVDEFGRVHKVLSYVVFFADLNQVTNSIAAMKIDVQEESLAVLFDKAGMVGKGTWFLINPKINIIIGSGDENIKPEQITTIEAKDPITLLRIRDKNYSIISQPILLADWQLIYCIPTNQLSADTRKIGVFTLIVFMTLLILSALAAIFISNRITSKISSLSLRMKSIQEEIHDDKDEIVEHAKDEVGALQENYEIMVRKLRNLIKDNYQAQLDKKEARIQLLQAQINPHFLYNVLDQINWMGVRAKTPEICGVATRLGRFYRIGLSKGKDIITLAEEVEHVRIYIDIQKYRLGEAVKFSFEIEDGIREYKVIKLVLQPLVENAIVHGILESNDQMGNVVIEARKSVDFITIIVKDDAGLLNVDKVRNALLNPNEGDNGGYGLRNVDERLRLFSSSEIGLQYFLDEKGWSVFKVKFPCIS